MVPRASRGPQAAARGQLEVARQLRRVARGQHVQAGARAALRASLETELALHHAVAPGGDNGDQW